jgi:hypothetical protein
MVEPPGDGGRAGIFEIDDGVLITVELILVEQGAGSMYEAGEEELGVTADALAIETREDGGGGGSVEAFVVIKDPDSQ